MEIGAANLMRWTGRVLGVLLLQFFLVIAVGEGVTLPSFLNPYEKPGLVAVAIMVIGLIIAWKWEEWGGLMVIGGYIFLAIIKQRLMMGWAFGFFPIAATLCLMSWLLRRYSHSLLTK